MTPDMTDGSLVPRPFHSGKKGRVPSYEGFLASEWKGLGTSLDGRVPSRRNADEICRCTGRAKDQRR